MNNEPIVIERTYSAPIAKVWSALTDRAEMKKWYFDLAAFEPVVGFEFDFTGGPPERPYVHKSKVVEVVEGKKIAYTWRYEGYEGNSVVSFELFAEGDSTRVVLTHAGLETFPASNPDLDRKNFVMGWTEIVGTSLPAYLQKK